MDGISMKIDREKRVETPNLWEIVTHGGLGQSDDNYPCDIVIEDELNDGWSWRRILNDNTLSDIETGEKDFYKSYNSYNRVISNDSGITRIEYVIPMKKIKVSVDISDIDKNHPIF